MGVYFKVRGNIVDGRLLAGKEPAAAQLGMPAHEERQISVGSSSRPLGTPMARIRLKHRLILVGSLSVLGFGLLSCDDGPPPLEEIQEAAAPKPQTTVNPVAAAALQKLQDKETQAAPTVVEAPSLTEKDFIESISNRDPFRSFIIRDKKASSESSPLTPQRRVLMKRYSLDELKLIAIISGATRPVAMFTDPTKKGITVKHGDYISKSEGRVKQILADKVIIEIEEQTEGKSTRTDRVVMLYQKGDESTLQIE